MNPENYEIESAFLADATEQLSIFEEELLNLEKEKSSPEIINRIFRAAHTLKGSAGFAGFKEIEQFAHLSENLLDLVREGSVKINSEILQLLFESRDILGEMIKCRGIGKVFEESEKSLELTEAMEVWKDPDFVQTVGQKPEKKEKVINYFRILLEFNENLFETGTDPLLIIDELSQNFKILESNLIVKNIPALNEIDIFKNYLNWQITVAGEKGRDELDSVFLFVAVDNKILIEKIKLEDLALLGDKIGEILVNKGVVEEEEIEKALEDHNPLGKDLVMKGVVTKKMVYEAVHEQEKVRVNTQLSSVRIDTQKLDEIINAVGEVVVAKSRIRTMVEKIRDLETEEEAIFTELDRYVHILQSSVMKARMMPVKDTFIQFRRMVRDLSRQQNKEIELEIVGEDTELDKNVIEKLKDPLKHMIRNSIDHGFETTEERIKAGKETKGRLLLKAYHEGGEVIIEVTDDGKGLEKEKIRKKALEKGLISEGPELTEDEIFRMIFLPGFSTAEKVSDISGRGVGMDVVLSNLNSIRGNILIKSEQGKGTTFKISIPLTLAIIEGILIRVNSSFFVIPIHSITEFLLLEENKLIEIFNRGKALPFRGKYISVINLSETLGFGKTNSNIITVVQSSNQFLGILVDEIIGKYQIVIKSLEENFRKVEFVSGATLLGDGSIAMILDINALVQKHNKRK